MRITKTIAREIAEKMVTEKQNQLQKEKQGVFVEITKEYFKTLPSMVLDVFENHKEFIRSSPSIWSGELAKQITFCNKEKYGLELPFKQNTDFRIPSEFVKKLNALTKKKQEVKNLQIDIENALFNLRTVANVEKNLPEAIPFLTSYVPTSTALTVNFSSIQERLK